jgi:hypothetical protein
MGGDRRVVVASPPASPWTSFCSQSRGNLRCWAVAAQLLAVVLAAVVPVVVAAAATRAAPTGVLTLLLFLVLLPAILVVVADGGNRPVPRTSRTIILMMMGRQRNQPERIAELLPADASLWRSFQENTSSIRLLVLSYSFLVAAGMVWFWPVRVSDSRSRRSGAMIWINTQVEQNISLRTIYMFRSFHFPPHHIFPPPKTLSSVDANR